MKKACELVDVNIANLTGLWSAIGKAGGGVVGEAQGVRYSGIAGAAWPNRVWFLGDVDAAGLEAVKGFMYGSEIEYTLPIWELDRSGVFDRVAGAGFEFAFGQVGMSLDLVKGYAGGDVSEGLSLEEVDNAEKAELWADSFEGAFGYRIDGRLVSLGVEGLRCLNVYFEGVVAGTVMLYVSGEVLGIHAMGVLPSVRGKGVGGELMKAVLNESVAAGLHYAVLQASDMGKGLYLKLGFEEQFLMRNYRLEG